MEHKKDIYSILNEIITSSSKSLHASDFCEEIYDKLSEEQDRRIFLLLKNISSLSAKYLDDTVVFSPAIELYGEGRTFGLQDMSEEDYKILEKLEVSKIPVLLQARIADILWTEKGNYKMASVAIKAYHELYVTTFDVEHWLKCKEYIKRSIVLAAKTGAKQFYNQYRQEIFEQILEMDGKDNSFFTISMTEFLLSQKWNNLEPLLPIMDNIIEYAKDNVRKVERAYGIKSQIYIRNQDKNAEMENNRKLALYYEKKAEWACEDNVQDVLNSEKYLQKAVYLYRNNASPEDGERVQRKLLDVQKKIPKFMIPIVVNKNDTQKYKDTVWLFENLSFKEHIVRIVQLVPFYTIDSLKKEVLEEACDPIACLFGTGVKSGKGQTIVDIPPLDIHNPEGNVMVLEMHMHHKAFMKEDIVGETYLKWAMDLLNDRFKYNKDNLKFIVEGNPIIPVGRENIFLSALYYGLKGDCYTALHILAPQTEKLFRNIAESVGGIMYTLENDGSSQEKRLTSVFNNPELIDCYDNDILFLFKGLMNEKSGANIRNEIAHGIMSESKGNSGVARFFLCSVMKLLSFTSKEYYKISRESKQLKTI